MDERNIANTALSGLNDDLVVTPYAHGYLVSLPLSFFDNDRVKLFVEPFDGGVKVSDRSSTVMRLVMADVQVDSDRVHQAIAKFATGPYSQFETNEGEIVAIGDKTQLADLIFDVDSAVIRVDQLRWTSSRTVGLCSAHPDGG